jgi:hypothetical protein
MWLLKLLLDQNPIMIYHRFNGYSSQDQLVLQDLECVYIYIFEYSIV